MAPTHRDLSSLTNETLKQGSYKLFQTHNMAYKCFIHKTLKYTAPMTYRKLLNCWFLHLLLYYQTAYLKIGKHAHLCFSIKQLISLLCMILGHQNLPRILENSKNLLALPRHFWLFTHALLENYTCVSATEEAQDLSKEGSFGFQ